MVTASIAQPADLLLWYNAVFLTIFGVGLIFTLLQLIGIGGESDVDAGGADADMDAHVEVGVDADVDVHVDAHLDADVDAHMDAGLDAHDAHVDHHVNGHFGFGSAVAQLFGLGKVPLSISLMLLCYAVGVAGWISNQILLERIESPAVVFPMSLLAALAVGFTVLRFASSLMARYAPPFSTTAIDPRQLVGSTATTVLPVDERIGLARLYDKFGTLHMVRCRTAEGAKPIAKGENIVLVKYLPDRQMYVAGRA